MPEFHIHELPTTTAARSPEDLNKPTSSANSAEGEGRETCLAVGNGDATEQSLNVVEFITYDILLGIISISSTQREGERMRQAKGWKMDGCLSGGHSKSSKWL